MAIVAGAFLGHILTTHDVGLPLRYEVSRLVQKLQTQPEPQRTTLVLIDDEEFWRGSLARRIPIRRDYLANLVRRISSCDPSAIALDFKLRAPVPTGTMTDIYGTVRDNCAYVEETEALSLAVTEVSQTTPLVLPISKSEDQVSVEPSVLDGVPDRPGHLVRGNISLPWDYREIPTAELIGTRSVNSFALAAAALLKPELLTKFPSDKDDPYDLSFIPPKAFPTVFYRESPGHPTQEECWQKIRHRLVVVGGAWHTDAYGTGALDDLRLDTPMGRVGAIYLHANYIEALIAGRARDGIPDWATMAIEIVSAFLVALVLATREEQPTASGGESLRPVRLYYDIAKFTQLHLYGVKYAFALTMAVGLLVLTYLFAQNFNLYADFSFPEAFLFAHALVNDFEELKSAKRDLRALREQVGHQQEVGH